MSTQKTRRFFYLQVSVTKHIAAPPETVWGLLTSTEAQMRWNSTIAHIEGTIAQGEDVVVKAAGTKQSFDLRVENVVEHRGMEWVSKSSGFLLKGSRTFTLEEVDGGTRFWMAETLSGPILPLIARTLPDFEEMFETYASDLEKAAHSAVSTE